MSGYQEQASRVVMGFLVQSAPAGPAGMVALLRAKAEVHQAVVDQCIRVAEAIETELLGKKRPK